MLIRYLVPTTFGIIFRETEATAGPYRFLLTYQLIGQRDLQMIWTRHGIDRLKREIERIWRQAIRRKKLKNWRPWRNILKTALATDYFTLMPRVFVITSDMMIKTNGGWVIPDTETPERETKEST